MHSYKDDILNQLQSFRRMVEETVATIERTQISSHPIKFGTVSTQNPNFHLTASRRTLISPTIINHPNNRGSTALHLAAAQGKLEVVRYLVNGEADLYAKDKSGKTPLDVALQNEHFDVWRYLNQANPVSTDPLLEAIKHNDFGSIRSLVDRCPNLNVKDSSGYTPLYTAIKYGRLNIVRYLIEKGVQLNVENFLGQTPLHFAANLGQLGIVRYLIEEMNIDKNVRDNWGRIPLHSAASSGNIQLVRYLVDDKDQDVNARDRFGCVPLYFANHNLVDISSNCYSLAIVRYLVEEKGVSVNLRNDLNETALHNAARFGNFHVLRYLVESGAEVEIKNREGNTPLHVAAKNGYLDIVRYLLEK